MERGLFADRADSIMDHASAASGDDKGIKSLVKKLRDES